MRITYTKTCTKIYDSYLIPSKELNKVVYKIIKERKAKDLPVTREVKSYVREIKTHNRLYKLGLFRSHTKDTDLEENITSSKEKIFMLIGRW